MRIFITGLQSFIGSELKQRCRKRGFEVTGIDTVESNDQGFHRMDIRSPDVGKAIPDNTDALIHLAAISRDSDCRKDLKLAFDVNVNGTINLMQAAQARKVKQFIFASSEWVYGNARAGETQTEDSAIDAGAINSEYALMKLTGERLLSMAHQRGFCHVTILRFGIVYGPRPLAMNPIEGLFSEVRSQDVLEIKGSLSSGRRFVHVHDIAEGIISSLGRTGFEIFNLSADKVITFREIIERSAAILNKSPRLVESDPNSINVRNPDNRKARTVLGWKPKVDLDAGLRTLVGHLQGGRG